MIISRNFRSSYFLKNSLGLVSPGPWLFTWPSIEHLRDQILPQVEIFNMKGSLGKEEWPCSKSCLWEHDCTWGMPRHLKGGVEHISVRNLKWHRGQMVRGRGRPGKAAVLVSWGEWCLWEKTSSGWGRNSTWDRNESTKLTAGAWCLCSRRFSEESRKAVGPFSLSSSNPERINTVTKTHSINLPERVNTVSKTHSIKLPERGNTVSKTHCIKLTKVTSESRWLERYLRRARGRLA